MHKTHIFDQKNYQKKKDFTDLPTLFFSDLYRKQTISFFRPYEIVQAKHLKEWGNITMISDKFCFLINDVVTFNDLVLQLLLFVDKIGLYKSVKYLTCHVVIN